MTVEHAIKSLKFLHDVNRWSLSEPNEKAMVRRKIAGEAIDILKAHEPRVLKLEEVHSLEQNEVVWLEDNGVEEIIPAIVVEHSHTYAQRSVCFMIVENPRLWIATFDYLNRWRCWTSRPTEEEREAVEWDE